MSVISGIKARVNGALAENRARNYLIKQGLTFVAANYHCRYGELDLIFKEHQQWVFVEVKSKQNSNFGNAEASYTQRKQTKVHKAIMHWMGQHELNAELTSFRIDLLAINGNEISWLKNVY